MRILQVLAEFELAGAQIMAENLIYELKNMGHTVKAVSLYSRRTPITSRIENNNIEIFYLGKNRGFDSKAIRKLRKIIKDYSPDVIHTHTYSLKYVLFALIGLKNIKIVHTIHNIASKETTEANRKLEKIAFKAKRVKPVAISPRVWKSIIEYYHLNKEQVPMIYNGISLNRCISKSSYGLHSEDSLVNIIHIGRMQEQKNHKMIVNAMKYVVKSHPEVRLHLYGDGELKEEIIKQINDNQLSPYIILEGLTDNPYEKLSNSDIFILPSKWEGMPITLIEAMGTGLPIVVTPVGGIPDMINNDESGLICDLTEESISAAIIKLIEDESLREKIGLKAMANSCKFDSKYMAQSYEKVYKS